MKKIAKYLVSLAIVLAVSAIPMTMAHALTVNDLGTDQVQNGTTGINLGNKSPMETATTLINTAMLFLGLIAVCIILMGGFKWMTAMGSEEKITEAKKLMSAGVVGIIIILSAWGITTWVLGTAVNVTTN